MLFVGLAFWVPPYFSAYAEPEKQEFTPESKELLLKMEQEMIGTLLTISENERIAGNDMSNFYYSIDLPAQQHIQLGLVLDTESPQEGYKVLSVTPNGIADQLAISTGDKIIEINGVTINAENNKQTIEQLKNAVFGRDLSLVVNSQGINKTFSTQLTSNYIPEIKIEIGSQMKVANKSVKTVQDDDISCGEISLFFNPPAARGIYPAYIYSLDNRTNIPASKKSFKLKPGKHTIYLHELISDVDVRRSKGRNKAKGLIIDVKPNMSYKIGAKFNRNKRFKVHNQEYWQPVVWSTLDKECSI